MIVSLLVMELFKKKDRPVSNNHPVYAQKIGHKDHLNKRRPLKGTEMHIIKNQSL